VLAADQRLRRSDDFATVIRRGRRAARDGLVVHLRAPDPTEPVAHRPRAGFVVPKAVGNAVTRNTVRRRLRHLLRSELDRLDPGTDVVVRVLPEAAGRRFDELGQHLREALAAAGRPRAARRSARG
jgi:ribonuclease P protein component